MKTLPGLLVAVTMVGTFALAISSTDSSAHEIGNAAVKKKHDLHETMTRIASECAAATAQNDRIDCRAMFGRIGKETRLKKTSSEGYLAEAVRWPDDPLRQSQGRRSKAPLAVNFINNCRKALGRGPNIDNGGLFCHGHYGKLQFFHSQTSSDDAGQSDLYKVRDVTRAKILAWARLSFRVATQQVDAPDALIKVTLCDIGKNAEFAVLAAPLRITPIDEECRIRKNNSPYTIAKLYSWRCTNIRGSGKCFPNSEDPEMARRAAYGAILHQLQDSFSQAHAARLADSRDPAFATGPFQAKVVCSPITVFYDYGSQNDGRPDANGEQLKEPHAKADTIPVLDDSCTGESEIHDILSASATVMRLVEGARIASEKGDSDMRRRIEDQAIRYLEDHVYKLTPLVPS